MQKGHPPALAPGRAAGWAVEAGRLAAQRLAAQRLAAQLLSGPPAATAGEVAGHLLAVQAQDPRGARLAIRARTTGLSAADVDRAVTTDRSLVISWLNRGTLHLVGADDYWWLHPLTTPQLLTGNTRRLAQEGVPPADADRAVAVIERCLAAGGPLTRAELRERITAAGVRTEGQALVHILALASLRGLIVRGPMMGTEQAFVLVRDWLGAPPPPVGREAALARLAHRFLAGHGPASDRDLAKWAGLPLGDARWGLTLIASALADRDDGLASLASLAHRDEDPPPVPSLRLLGAFDPLLLGWASRDLFLAPGGPVVTVNGLFRPFALLRGRAAAIWSYAAGKVRLEPLGQLTESETVALAAEVADIERFLGGRVSSAAGPGSSG